MPILSMPLEQQIRATTWVVAGSDDALAPLTPLISAHRTQRPVRVLKSPEFAASDLEDAASLLVIGKARRTAGASLPGVFLETPDGRRVPVGWLPDVGDRLETYARAAAEVQLRRVVDAATGPFVLLGEFDGRALDTVQQVARVMPQNTPVFQWTAERLRRQDLISALRCGPGAAFYFGHATAAGWAGYAGFDKTDAVLASGDPLGAILSVSCSVAARPRKGLSFCEELVLSGLCAAALGAGRRTLHHQNVELGVALAQALASTMTLADLLFAARISGEALARYRIVGDPLAPLIGHSKSLDQARAVFAPAPNDILPVIPLSAWKEPHLEPVPQSTGFMAKENLTLGR
jgi:Peptidase family C25